MKLGQIVITTQKGMKRKCDELARWTGGFLASPEYNLVLEKLAAVPEAYRRNAEMAIIGNLALIDIIGGSVPEYLGNITLEENGSISYAPGVMYPDLENLMMTIQLENRYTESLEPVILGFKDYLSIIRGAAVGKIHEFYEKPNQSEYLFRSTIECTH